MGLLLICQHTRQNLFEPARVKQYITSYSKIQPEISLRDSDTKLRAETGSNAEAITKNKTNKRKKTAFKISSYQLILNSTHGVSS